MGSGTYIDNFEDQIVGHTPGETFDVTVTFPEDYGNEDLNGKEAVFETTLNYIKESVTPELTDDWVKENLGESMSLNSVDELKAFVKSTMLYDNQASDVYTDLHDKAATRTSCRRPRWTTTAMCCCTAFTPTPRNTAPT